jgi:hypothetical protein
MNALAVPVWSADQNRRFTNLAKIVHLENMKTNYFSAGFFDDGTAYHAIFVPVSKVTPLFGETYPGCGESKIT